MRQKKPMKRPIQTFPQNTKIYHGDEEVSPKKLQSSISPKKTIFHKTRRGSHPSIFRQLYPVRPQNNSHRIYKLLEKITEMLGEVRKFGVTSLLTKIRTERKKVELFMESNLFTFSFFQVLIGKRHRILFIYMSNTVIRNTKLKFHILQIHV